ncbi:hypothetical protein SLEP1_g15726 [Rubroshorea leprosula]|uniref:Uncharacterized protein n=1 Tax=Rubroshorea leprosula TaxID=152421 RepID=A0AAV5INF9_9ROSI|nr:hypothetical protein SLEP1_g15726 [Rubroshorea leprosula]
MASPFSRSPPPPFPAATSQSPPPIPHARTEPLSAGPCFGNLRLFA